MEPAVVGIFVINSAGKGGNLSARLDSAGKVAAVQATEYGSDGQVGDTATVTPTSVPTVAETNTLGTVESYVTDYITNASAALGK